jgi:hypothetical protein
MTNKHGQADTGAPGVEKHGIAGELVVDALAGAAAGAAAGALAGPPGMAIGAILGGAIGAAAGEVAHLEHAEEARADEQLDRDIGVIGGDIGAAPPDQPPGRGVFHAASMGVSTGHTPTPSEGPIQDIEED